MQTNVRALDANGGLLIEARCGTELKDLDRAWVIGQFAREGVLLLRGFQPDDAQFHRFARQFADRFLVDPMPGRISQAVAAEVQTVAPGNETLNLHYEYGITPFRPDLIWLYCSHPARVGGETTVCDGIRIWRDLSTDARALLSTTRIQYASAIPVQAWRTFFAIPQTGHAARERLAQMLSQIKDFNYRLDPATDALSMLYRALGVGPCKFSKERAFIGTILPDVYRDFPPACLEGGTAIPNWLLAEVTRVTQQLTVTLAWQPGDIAMIDNTRWMHGRMAFSSPGRRVLSLTAYVNFEPNDEAPKAAARHVDGLLTA